MMRKSPTTSMQKTYDECYLICSTAIYFEGQNNEGEALRAWRNALDQIYYHNAYKMPSGYAPRTETEKALQDSLRSMELQCKERVDLLEALRKSRVEAEEDAKTDGDAPSKSKESLASVSKPPLKPNGESTSWLGGDTVPQATYSDLPRAVPGTPDRERRPPPQPKRPTYTGKLISTDDVPRTMSLQPTTSPNLAPPSGAEPRARTPSPEKKPGGMLKTLRSNTKERTSSGKMVTTMRSRPPPSAASKAASQVWPGQQPQSTTPVNGAQTASPPPTTTWNPFTRSLVPSTSLTEPPESRRTSDNTIIRPPSPSDFTKPRHSNSSLEDLGKSKSYPPPYPDYPVTNPYSRPAFSHSDDSVETTKPSQPPPPPPHRPQEPRKQSSFDKPRPPPPSLSQLGPPSSLSYMKEYPNHPPAKPQKPTGMPGKREDRTSDSDAASGSAGPKTVQAKASPRIPRKAVGLVSAMTERQKLDNNQSKLQDRVQTDPNATRNELTSSSPEPAHRKSSSKKKAPIKPSSSRTMTPPSSDESPEPSTPTEEQEWDRRVKRLMKNLPKGVDEGAAKQIFNEIVIQGDEVHWDDVAGLEIAKSALKETVVYPFLRPDLFMGLREPARGMLLFGPPGTGKTMLARCVATESKSVFFAISASSLTSKYLGESEKLVRALFALAKALAPSIIFVDEIDSLLGSRGGSSEHEATRRIKTEFLIQWSDLQKAAAGREEKDKEKGDASRVLVLAATNLPWAIDEAARRRFVRRQYIPLPEDWVREKQLRTLLAAQRHSLRSSDFKVLVRLTEGFSGSDITALTKDAAMGPLRSLGEKLLHMRPEDIRGIGMKDFEASLVNIRPSVGQKGLQEFEDWAREFGERGG